MLYSVQHLAETGEKLVPHRRHYQGWVLIPSSITDDIRASFCDEGVSLGKLEGLTLEQITAIRKRLARPSSIWQKKSMTIFRAELRKVAKKLR